jgi:hypothetical protein
MYVQTYSLTHNVLENLISFGHSVERAYDHTSLIHVKHELHISKFWETLLKTYLSMLIHFKMQIAA